MNVADVAKAVKQIRRCAADAEKAHGLEDALWESVLEAIAGGEVDNPEAVCLEALKTRKINFARWYA